MTYGEYYYLVKYDMKLVDGSWIVKSPNMKIPHKMPREEASIYYTLKFREYLESIGMVEDYDNLCLEDFWNRLYVHLQSREKMSFIY